jgi:hypothetical protein
VAKGGPCEESVWGAKVVQRAGFRSAKCEALHGFHELGLFPFGDGHLVAVEQANAVFRRLEAEHKFQIDDVRLVRAEEAALGQEALVLFDGLGADEVLPTDLVAGLRQNPRCSTKENGRRARLEAARQSGREA